MRVVVLGAILAFVGSTIADPEERVISFAATAHPQRLGHMSVDPGAPISLVDPASVSHFRESSPDKLISLLQGVIFELQENNHRMKAELESFRSWTMLMEEPPAQATPNDSQEWKAMSSGIGYGIGASFLFSMFYGIFARGSRGAKGMNMKLSDGADFQSSAATAFPLIPSGASNARLRTVGVVMSEGKGCGGGEATGDTESTEASKRSDAVVEPMWKAYEATLQNIIDRGEAATMEEAGKVWARQGHEATLQNIIDRGEAATMEEARQVWARQGREASFQKIIDRGEAATMEEARQVLGRQGYVVLLQKVIDRGEAATMEEAQQVLGRQAHKVTLQRIINRGEAATIHEAQQLLSSHGRAAAASKDPLGPVVFSEDGGVGSALAAGKYSKYPGVNWRSDTKTWRVRFYVDGKRILLGSYPTEEQGAEAHDRYVRANKLSRPLHFPRDGEVSSRIFYSRHADRQEQRRRDLEIAADMKEMLDEKPVQ